MELHLFVLLKRKKYISCAADFGWQRSAVLFIVNLREEEGHLAGILPQIWPHSAGLVAPLVYQESSREAFSRALEIEKLKS